MGNGEKESGRGYQVSGEKSESGDPNTRYQITNTHHISLRIYDLLGREVAVLVDEERPAGVFTATWNARQTTGGQGANMPSGVYFYRLTAGSYFETKKMLLLR